MVAPNSPIALAKHRIMPAMMPGTISGRVTVRNTQARFPQGSCRLLQFLVDRLDRQADGAHHQREAHDGTGERGAGPAEREHDAEIVRQERPDRPAPPEQDQQEVAGDDGRQHQREQHEPVEERVPQKRPRASTMAMAMPKGRLTRVATVATLRLSITAVHSSGLRVNHSPIGNLGSPTRSNA